MTQKINVLIKLHSGYGMGDSVQMNAVLRHVAKNRPNWNIDWQADPGRAHAALGHVRRIYTTGVHEPFEGEYDRVIPIMLFNIFPGFTDRPNTRVVTCLQEKFGMTWERELCEYKINVSTVADHVATEFFLKLDVCNGERLRQCFRGGAKLPYVAIHYEGDSIACQKNLANHQAAEIRDAIVARKRTPILLDWRGTSSLIGGVNVSQYPMLAGLGGDAQVNAAIISRCESFVGIDSGPGKVASGVGAKTLICWTDLHPCLYHDPHEGTTHLVPERHRENPALNGNEAAAIWFEQNYDWIPYRHQPGRTLVDQVKRWLDEVLDDDTCG